MKNVSVERRFVSVLVMLAFLVMNIVSAQNKEIDSLKKGIETRVKDTSYVKTLNNLSLATINNGQFPEATEYANRAFILADKIGYDKGKAYALKNKGTVAYYQQDYLTVLNSWSKSLAIFETIQDEVALSNMLNNLGIIYYAQAGNIKSLEYFQKVLTVGEKMKDTVKICHALLNIGGIYLEEEDYDQALNHFQQIEKYRLNLTDPYINDQYFISMGELFSKKRNHQKALEFFKEALELNKDTMKLAITLIEIGKEEKMLGNSEKGLEYLNLAYKTAVKYNQEFDALNSLIEIGVIQGTKNYNKALDVFKESEVIAKEMDATNALREIYKEIYQVYKAKGDINNAFNYLTKFVAVNDSIVKRQIEEQKKTVLFDFEIGKANEEIKIMQKEATISNLNVKKQKYVIYGTIISLILVFIVALGTINRYREIKKTNIVINKEREKSENLLLNILPVEIAEELKLNGSVVAKNFETVSIIFTDFKDFTQTSERLSAEDLVAEINYCYETFDHICDNYGIEKIKTIGDSYMCASGIPLSKGDTVKNTVLAALDMQSFINSRFEEKRLNNEVGFEMRLGINTGPIVAGIVGVKKFQYDIWGDTVNIASRMESNGAVGKVNISEYTFEMIKEDPLFSFESRGKIEVKGKGKLEMYFVENA